MNRTARSVYQVVSCVWSGIQFDDFLTLDQRQWRVALAVCGVKGPHVVGVRQAEVVVEAVPGRQEFRAIAQVPLAVDGGGVVAALEDLGDQGLVGVDADLGARPECSQDTDAVRVAAGQQRGPRGRADGLGDVEVGEDAALFGHAVEVGRGVALCAKGADVGVAQVVGEDDDDVGRTHDGGGRRV